MSEKEKDQLLDHDYDGIKEFDNDLPPWWKNLFYITIVWAVLYLLYFHVFQIGYLPHAEYSKQIDPNWTRLEDPSFNPFWMKFSYRSPMFSPGDVTPRELAERGQLMAEEEVLNFEPLTDAASLEEGKVLFDRNCGPNCHGMMGEGMICPNLTDEYWLHSEGDINGIIRTIRNGVPAKGMISWKRVLKPDEIHKAGSYTYSLYGTNPPNAKKPEGEQFSRTPASESETPSDSLQESSTPDSLEG